MAVNVISLVFCSTFILNSPSLFANTQRDKFFMHTVTFGKERRVSESRMVPLIVFNCADADKKIRALIKNIVNRLMI